jgi:hypothetical protein
MIILKQLAQPSSVADSLAVIPSEDLWNARIINSGWQ